MFNNALITERMGIIHSSVKRLAALAQMPLDQFSKDEDAVDIAENRLRRALEALFDLGRHLVIKSGAGVPSDYRSVIEKLKDAKILPGEFAHKIIGMAGYRNRLIHDYNKITPAELHEIIQTRLEDFTLFCQYVATYLQQIPQNVPHTAGRDRLF
ncbi:MAG: DUF86 domain-containing protein [Thermoanaerobacteraceae bacterium]|nr:DUF86 domain-containing protein [Thermoanaerobacteraceae bacterium]